MLKSDAYLVMKQVQVVYREEGKLQEISSEDRPRQRQLIIDTINGEKSSAIIYSIAEMAKANQLKFYVYFEYCLRELPEHMEDPNRTFPEKLFPWSADLH